MNADDADLQDKNQPDQVNQENPRPIFTEK